MTPPVSVITNEDTTSPGSNDIHDRMNIVEGDMASLTKFVKTLYDHVKKESNTQRDQLIDCLIAVEKENASLISELTNSLINIENLLINNPSKQVINAVPSKQTYSRGAQTEIEDEGEKWTLMGYKNGRKNGHISKDLVDQDLRTKNY